MSFDLDGVKLNDGRLELAGHGVFRLTNIVSATKEAIENKPDRYAPGATMVFSVLFGLSALRSFFSGEFTFGQWGDVVWGFDVNIWGSLFILLACGLAFLGGLGFWQDMAATTRYWVLLSMSSGQDIRFEVSSDTTAEEIISVLGNEMS